MDDRHPEVEAWLQADAEAVVVPDLWSSIEAELDAPSWRDRLASLPTTTRRLLAVGAVGAFGAALIAGEGVREDLDGTGWAWFGLAAAPLVLGGALAIAASLRSSAAPPIGRTAPFAALWGFLTLWTLLAPFPGITGVPAPMHAICFGAIALATLCSALVLALLEQGRRAAVWRIALGTGGAGLVGYAAQSVFCPGIDLVHMLLGHVAPGMVVAGLAATVAWWRHTRTS